MAYNLTITEKAEELLDNMMKYIIIFEVEDYEVTILGIFHQLENYPMKM